MKPSQSLSASYRRLSGRERRVIGAGATLSLLGLLTIWVALPFVGRWGDREHAITARQAQLGQLRALLENEPATRTSLETRQRERVVLSARLLTGATPALAASNLQALLQGYADGSRVTLDRVDVVAEPGAENAGDLPAIPVRLSGQGDIYGLTALLERFQFGEKLLIMDELTVTAGNGEYQPDLLNFSVRLHGAYSAE